jgi:V/A-type H+-transporting ATPase subunit G/H
MSFDAITGIAQAEDAAKVAVQYAQAQAKQMLADAESEGKAEIDAAVARAEKELRVLRQKSDAKSLEDAKKLLNELETKKAVLQAQAEAKLDAAASLVAERVIKG